MHFFLLGVSPKLAEIGSNFDEYHHIHAQWSVSNFMTNSTFVTEKSKGFKTWQKAE